MRSLKFTSAAGALAALSLLLAACGSSGSGGGSTASSLANPLSSGGYSSPTSEPLTCATHGGTLNVLDESDFEHLDPGIAYYALDYTVVYATQSPLYMFKPNTETEPSPLMAASQPEISNGGKTITIHLREGVRFSPPSTAKSPLKTSPTRSSGVRTPTSPTPTSIPTSNRSKAPPRPKAAR